MAKKIRLDFSKTEERSGLNTRHIPEGLHSMKIAGVKVTEANDGTAMLVYELVPTEAKYKTRRFPFYCKLQQNQLFKVRDLLVAAGISVPKKALNIDPEAPVGKIIAAEVEDESNPQYAGRSTVQAVYGADIIDGEDSPEDDEESEDEEYEEEYEDGDDESDEDEDEADEDDEDEEGEDDEELREELDALTLPALRKRAKGLGIDTTGVKRDELTDLVIEEELAEAEDEEADEEDDDLDDEELADEEDDEEYEDDEDEEEEEAPAPKRTVRKAAPAKKAPAKKAPAKAAPKATATRRTVKRR